MKRHALALGSALIVAVALGGCDSSKVDLEKAKADLATVTTERDALKTQLDAANAHQKELAAQVTDLTTKLAAAKPAKPGTEKGTEHAQMTPATKESAKRTPNSAKTSAHKKG